MLAPFFTRLLNEFQQNWREAISMATVAGIPDPAFSASLGHYDSYRSTVLPANLLQAQRDFFGAHAYERDNKPRGEFFHTVWPKVIGQNERRFSIRSSLLNTDGPSNAPAVFRVM